MKRCVKEYASYIIASWKNSLAIAEVKAYAIEEAEKTVNLCEKGYITVNEAMKKLVNIDTYVADMLNNYSI